MFQSFFLQPSRLTWAVKRAVSRPGHLVSEWRRCGCGGRREGSGGSRRSKRSESEQSEWSAIYVGFERSPVWGRGGV
eukprot:1365232-Amorphochlora_amoeboformis.AAC.2